MISHKNKKKYNDNFSKVKHYKYNKKWHYISNCIKALKNYY